MKNPIFKKENISALLLLLYSILLISINILRLFNDNFWADECLTVIIVNRDNIAKVLTAVSGNGHTPLYYLIVYLGGKVLGYSGFSYHFLSTLPYFILMIIGITWVRKHFSIYASLILITFMTLLDHTLTYNLEVRMYAWCELFIFLTFIFAYQIYTYNKTRYHVLISLSSLFAVYCHYYSLASVGIIYLFLLNYYLIHKDFKTSLKVFVSGLSVIILFIPWLIFCIKTSGTFMSNYNIAMVSLWDCVGYIFVCDYTKLIALLFLIIFCLWTLYSFKIFNINKISDKYRLSFNMPQIKNLDKDIIWAYSGLCAVFGTIFAAQLISHLFYSIITSRYLYPSFVILWLLFGVSVSHLKFKKIWTILPLALVIISGSYKYIDMYNNEATGEQKLEETLALTPDIGKGSYIVTNIYHLSWTVLKVYYPEAQSIYSNLYPLPNLDKEKDNWLFLSSPISEETKNMILDQGFIPEEIVNNGDIGTYTTYIYHLINED